MVHQAIKKEGLPKSTAEELLQAILVFFAMGHGLDDILAMMRQEDRHLIWAGLLFGHLDNSKHDILGMPAHG